jgi:hypothetical protein
VANKQPIEANYQDRHRLFCPHRLGRNREGQLRVLCYEYGGESRSGLDPLDSSANWPCVALEKLSRVECELSASLRIGRQSANASDSSVPGKQGIHIFADAVAEIVADDADAI